MKNAVHYLSVAILAGAVACSEGKTEAEEDAAVETILPEMTNAVTVMKLEITDFHHELISNGKLLAGRSADMRFESAEPVAAIHVRNGDRVDRGQPVAELAAFRLENKTVQARDALDRAKLDLQDILIGQGFAPDDSSAVPPATWELALTKSGYRQAQAQYELALHEARNAVLRAPFDGVVANLFSKTFNQASTSDVFCTIIDPGSLEASFSVLENELSLIRTGDRVVITPFARPADSVEGVLSEINPLVDENGTVRVKARISHPGQLFEGMNVRVSIQRSLGKQMVVPKEAVVIRSGKQVVFTLVDGKANWVYVRTGLENASQYTIVEGLNEGDIIITDGNINLAHESPVEVKQ
ncbi:MAG: efflux RND transporter periplasmic adaptor subunit [Tannerella sp.]|jgi:RND family efflux transporter MFP subunit|nr:efflux RND transporter periplasmic adaptor subunit [Tannerella sp.]